MQDKLERSKERQNLLEKRLNLLQNRLERIAKMQNLSSNDIKQITKIQNQFQKLEELKTTKKCQRKG